MLIAISIGILLLLLMMPTGKKAKRTEPTLLTQEPVKKLSKKKGKIKPILFKANFFGCFKKANVWFIGEFVAICTSKESINNFNAKWGETPIT